MSAFTRRRRRGFLVLLVAGLAGWGFHSVLDLSLRQTHLWSGWLLLALVLALTLFNARKKLPFLPLGNGVAWMEFHAYAGLFSVLVFLAHVGVEVPNGPLEVSLWTLFVLVAGSGILGIVMSRTLPVRLATRGEAVLFERIPSLRLGLQTEVEEIVLDAAREDQGATIADFYAERLADFFRKPRNLFFHLADSARPYRSLERELSALDRYANDREREILSEIGERVKLKDDLDYQHAQQLALKGWLFFHIPLTYSLIVVAGVHVLLVLGFHGGIR